MSRRVQRFDPRQNMKKSTFEIFHYLDPRTRHLEAHYHDFFEVFFFIDGDMDYWIDGSLYHLVPGDILLINPTQLHKPMPRGETDKYERIVLWVDKNYLNTIEGGIFLECFDLPSGKVLRLEESEREFLFSLALNLCKEAHSSDFANEVYSYSLLLQLLTVLTRISKSKETVDDEEYSTPTFIAEILSYINENYSLKLSLETIAAKFFVNKFYLAHEFKKSVGTSLYRYITLKRLNVAYSLLMQKVPASEVSSMCGFSDYTAFFRAFKTEFGISPTSVLHS